MRKWWHEKRGHNVTWKFYPPMWVLGDPVEWVCSCGKKWWVS